MYYLIGSLVALIGTLIAVRHFNILQENKRIDDFEKNFDAKYKGAGVVISLLIPSGILNLKNDKETKKALNKIQNKLGYHPFRQRSRIEYIEKYGCKKFFQESFDKKIQLSPDNIDSFIEELKSQKRKV